MAARSNPLRSHRGILPNPLMHLQSRFALLPLAVALVVASVASAQAPRLVSPPDVEDMVSLRAMFGMDRFTPRRWDGELRVQPGRVVRMAGVHFEGRDKVEDGNRWLLTNRVTRYADSTTQRGYDPVHTSRYAMIPNGVAATVDATESASIDISTVEGDFGFPLADLQYGRPLSFLSDRASVERIPTTLDLTEGPNQNDYPALAASPDGSVWASWISYLDERDAVWLSRHDGEGWAAPVRVTPDEYGDNFRTAMQVDGNGAVVVAWSGRGPGGTWGLYARTYRDGVLSDLSSLAKAGENLYHQAVADRDGNVHVAWQGFRNQQSRILHARWDGESWSGEEVVSDRSHADSWSPAVAADSRGNMWVGWDAYGAGNFDVHVRRLRADGRWDRPVQVTRSAGFDANVSLTCDSKDRLWIAWDRGEANWGKDWSSQRFDPGGGAGLYRHRSVQVAVLEGGRARIAPDLMEAIPPESQDYVQQARLITDASGQVWAMMRSLTSVTTRVNNNWGAGGIWEMYLSRLDGDAWLPAIKLFGTNGRNDIWASATRDAEGRIWFAWSRDARPFGSPSRATTRGSPAAQSTQVSYTVVDPSHSAWGDVAVPRLSAFRETDLTAVPVHPTETEDTAAIRDYRYQVGDREYRILRGDLHRHTDISSDGIGEGGLIDFYRYAITAGQYDFMLVADHQYGGDNVPGVEYNWWRTEKSEDIFRVSGRFWPLFGTERSLPYPNGHRNTVFARRGVRWMPIQAGERNGSVNTGDVLFPYLRRYGGISTPHTSGSDQGTDWRDVDPEVEPVVEIYQSLHASYEYPGAPRAETRDKRYFHHGEPWRPLGFVWKAWAKGIKIGVQASSDHVGTHDSYACVLVPADGEPTRQDLIDGMKARRTYAATDNIILDVRIQGRVMGEAFTTSEPPTVTARVIGTGPLERIVLIRNNEIVHTVEPDAQSVDLEYRDASSQRGESYYYLRAEQADGSLAWSSPIWVDYRP